MNDDEGGILTPNFDGHQPRECGEHRTLGPHRAWCFECHEYCYPSMEMACKGCELASLRPVDGWWTIAADAFMDALRRVEAGESADVVYLEFYAHSHVDRPDPDEEEQT